MIEKMESQSQLIESPMEKELLDVSVSNGGAQGNGASLSEVPVSKEQKTDVEEPELKAILEALLFASPDPLSLEKLVSLLESSSKLTIERALKALQLEYQQKGRGLLIAEIAGGFVMVTSPELGGWVKRLQQTRSTPKLSRSALETLAIISYKQPLTRSDIEKIRGIETSSVLRTLLDQKLVRIVGRQDVPGRPIVYGTSKQFLKRFGLRDLRDLPPLKEIKELGGSETLSLPFEEGTRSGSLEPLVSDLPV